MRLSQLSRAAGLSQSTVKWYLRIGLLHRGEQTAINQARYDDGHLQRLRLIRALVEVGGLSTEDVGEVLAPIDDPAVAVGDVLAVAHRACATPAVRAADHSAGTVDDFLGHRGWRVRPDSPARNDLAAALDAIAGLQTGPDVATAQAVSALLDPYADAVEPLAAAEVAGAPDDLPRELLVERVVAGTILLERALTALRRLAQEHYSGQRHGDPGRYPDQ